LKKAIHLKLNYLLTAASYRIAIIYFGSERILSKSSKETTFEVIFTYLPMLRSE